MCCANATSNHKLKLLLTGKAKRPQSFKGTKANCIPVHYFNQNGAQIDEEIFQNWFHKHFVPEVKAEAQKAILLLYNAPSHERERVQTSDNGLIVVKFMLPLSQLLCAPWIKK
jgi:hypothetical protein